MSEKRRLVADMLHIPVDEYDNIAEMACEVDGEKDSRELLLASISHADRLTSLINNGITSPQSTPQDESLRIVEEGEEPEEKDVMVTLSAHQLLNISAKLNEQLIQLLSLVTAQDAKEAKPVLSADATSLVSEEPSEQTDEGLPSRPVSLVSMESTEEVVHPQEEPGLGSPISAIASQQEVDVEFERLHILDEEDEDLIDGGQASDEEPPPPPPDECNCSSEERNSSSTEEEFTDAVASDSQNNNLVG
eukprot:GHVO01001815.1.p1 GENE.GHVO01001815.1~~GHVO01001815.1.p1  ORF type:complete len:248 (+),score=47.85 GHVO01001815.1:222-965(+)